MLQENQIDQLMRLKELLDSGILTQEEFEKEKEKVLNSTPVISPQNSETSEKLIGGISDGMKTPPEVNFALAKDEVILSKVKCTYGVYPSVNSFMYLTNQRIVIKSVPLLLHFLGFIFNFNTLYSKTKADIPLSSIVSIKQNSLQSIISDGYKTHHLFKIMLGSAGFDEAIKKAASIIKQEYGKDVLIQ